MLDVNMVIASNIKNELKKANKTQDDLAYEIGISKDMMNMIMNGTRMINRLELEKISKYFNVSIESLMTIPKNYMDTNVIDMFIKRVNTKEAQKGIELADELSDMILFHNRIYRNDKKMEQSYDDNKIKAFDRLEASRKEFDCSIDIDKERQESINEKYGNID